MYLTFMCLSMHAATAANVITRSSWSDDSCCYPVLPGGAEGRAHDCAGR